jgi:chemotaxis protein histidine kinase CheA
MVDQLGGRIGIATKPGRFTRFRISMPLGAINAAAA